MKQSCTPISLLLTVNASLRRSDRGGFSVASRTARATPDSGAASLHEYRASGGASCNLEPAQEKGIDFVLPGVVS
jgi:hypothetical protein